MKSAQRSTHSRSRGFSLLEVLLATFILGIGLIMVASVFPVGANWTRESTQNSVAQTIALNALSVIQAHYGPGSSDPNHTGAYSLSNKIISGSNLQGLPNFTGNTGIPLVERCYQFGNTVPFPATNPNGCLYYWTAMAKSTQGSNGASHDLYIFVFRKGDATQTFTVPAGATLAGGGTYSTSDTATPPNFPTYNYLWQPILVEDNYNAGTWDSTTQTVINAVPPVGYVGVGVTSGTVFRQTLNMNYSALSSTTAAPQPGLTSAPERVIYAPHPDGVSGSPLIYVYQTTVPF